jgi:glucokinase
MGILGIDIGGTNLRVGLVNQNELVRVESLLIKKECRDDEVLNDLYELIEKFRGDKLEGIGVGVPSVVDVEGGIVYDVQNIPSWKEVHLKKILESKYHIPVYVNNDANCFAVGEKYFGKVKHYKDIIGLIIGTGLGAGVIINNQLYAGNNCGAGEFGNIPFKDHTYEYYCSGQYFTNEYGLSGKELFKRAENNDAKALEIFAQFGSNFGETLKMIMYAMDPEVIVLGGSVSKSFQFFKEEMWKSVKTFFYSKSAEKIKIEVSERENIAILGAAALYYDIQKNKK